MLADFYQVGAFPVSFELFPPKTDNGMRSLMEHVERLVEFEPAYITCTYGAGGSTRGRTLDVVQQVKDRFSVPVASHLTCVGADVDQLRAYLREAQQRGVDYIVALRGDPPQGETTFTPNPAGLRYANEMVELIRGEFPHFGIAVAGYPETHQEAPSPEADLDNLKRKVDAGADVIITQLFFDNSDFYAWRERCDRAGINVPIVPGIFPIGSLAQISKIAQMCKACIPPALLDRLNQHPEDTAWHAQVGIEHAINQTLDLYDNQVPGLHFYVLNQSATTAQIMTALNQHRSPKQENTPTR